MSRHPRGRRRRADHDHLEEARIAAEKRWQADREANEAWIRETKPHDPTTCESCKRWRLP